MDRATYWSRLADDLIMAIGDKRQLSILPWFNAYKQMTGIIDESIDLSWVPEDFGTFCREYLTPSNETFGLSKFDPFPFQEQISHEVNNSRVVALLKSRQLGCTDTLAAIIIHKMLGEGKNKKGFKAIVYSISQTDSKKFGDRIIAMMTKISHRIPRWILSSRSYKMLAGGYGSVEFLPCTSGRGITADLVVVDESDFIPNVEDLLRAAKPTLAATGGTLVLISTPNGDAPASKHLNNVSQNLSADIEDVRITHPHYKVVRKVIDGEVSTGMLIHYKAHPHYTDNWARLTKEALGYTDDEFSTEYELKISSSVDRFFKQEAIDKCISYIPSRHHNCMIWSGLDTGGVNDFMSYVVISYNRDDGVYRIIDEIYEKTEDTVEQEQKIIDSYNKFDVSVIIPEINHDKSISDRFSSIHLLEVIPHFTTYQSKVTGLKIMRRLINEGRLLFNYESSLVEELPNFLKKTNGSNLKLEARAGYHDDSIMATANTLLYMTMYLRESFWVTEAESYSKKVEDKLRNLQTYD